MRAIDLPAPRVRGRFLVPADRDVTALLQHVAAGLRARECPVREEGESRLVLEGGTSGRYSPLAFVDGGTIWLAAEPGGTMMHYDMSTAGGLLLCAILSPVAAASAWFGTGSVELMLFGLLAPILWLYGANYALASGRVPTFLGELCRSAPKRSNAGRASAAPAEGAAAA